MFNILIIVAIVIFFLPASLLVRFKRLIVNVFGSSLAAQAAKKASGKGKILISVLKEKSDA